MFVVRIATGKMDAVGGDMMRFFNEIGEKRVQGQADIGPFYN